MSDTSEADTKTDDQADDQTDQTDDRTEDQATSDEASDTGPDESSDDSSDESSDESDEGEGENGGTAEVVDVAPDPDQTGVEVDKPKRAEEMSAEELEEIRKERLDPENRPEGAEVDNTQRTFDVKSGHFEDSDVDSDVGPFVDPEDPNQDEED